MMCKKMAYISLLMLSLFQFQNLSAQDLTGGSLLGDLRSSKSTSVSDSLRQFYPNAVVVPPNTPVDDASTNAPDSVVITTVPPSIMDLPVDGGMINIRILVAGDIYQVSSTLESLGMVSIAARGQMITGKFPIANLAELENIDTVLTVSPSYADTRSGSVVTQGDVAMRTDLVRQDTSLSNPALSGEGVTVGVLSDSYDCPGGPGSAATDIANGDLPDAASINIIQELNINGSCNGSDEGRAMMQIVHDVAPGADLAFHTAFGGEVDFADGIEELAEIGLGNASIIVDDVFYYEEPFFQDGFIAQSVKSVVDSGVVYLVSAGNSGKLSWEGPFRSSGQSVLAEGDALDFDPAASIDTKQRLIVPSGAGVRLALQWDQPYYSLDGGSGGAATDLDIALVTPDGTIVASSVDRNIGADPLEVISYTNTSGVTTLDLVIEKYAGPDPTTVKYVAFRGVSEIAEYSTDSSTVVGHANADGALSVGAAGFYNTPAFNNSAPILQNYSSRGGTSIFMDPSGVPFISPLDRDNPDFTGPDCGNTSFFGVDFNITGDPATDTAPNFCGTSAAAPHAAAATALLLEYDDELTPADVESILESTSIDIGPVGYDADSGAGLIDLEAAFAVIAPPTPLITAPTAGSVLSGSTESLQWSGNGSDVIEYAVYAGSEQGSNSYYDSGTLDGAVLTTTLSNLPLDGSTVWVRLFFRTASGPLLFIDQTYTAALLTPPTITSPSAGGTQLAGTSVTFSWTDSSGAIAVFRLIAGSSEGEDDYFASGNLGDDTSVVATGLPNDGESTVYVRLFYKTATGTEQFIDTTYEAAPLPPPVITAPSAGGTQLAGTSVTFSWTDSSGAIAVFRLIAGSSEGEDDYFASGNLGDDTSVVATGLPNDGESTVYVRLFYKTATGTEQFIDTTYEAAPLPPPVITAPSAGGTQLAGTSVTFSWTDSSGAIAVFRLIAGSSEGEDDYFASGNLGDDTSVVATGLPNDGESTVYVRLFYKTATGTEQFIDTTYEAAPLPPPVITAPSAGGTQLAGTSVTFSWTDSSGAIAVFRLIAGSSEGEDDYFASGNLGDDTSVVATGLPNDGESTVYVRLFYKTATGTEQFIDTTYEAAPLPPPVITAPSAGGTQLAGTSVTFSWTDSSGAIAVFRLIAGSSEGEDDYFASGNLGDDTSVVATGLPNDGESTVYVRLFYKTATGTEQFIDTTYEAAPLPPPVITAPSAGGTQLAGTSVTFSWTDSSGAIAVFRLIAGSSEGEDDYFASGNLGDDTSVVATGLPNDGESTVYVRLFYKTATGTEQFIDTTYEAAPLPPPVITAPSAGGTQLAGTSVTFSWTDSSGAIAVFRLIAGSSEGEDDYFASGNLGDDTSVVATGLPNDGESTVYVRLFYKTATGTEQFIDTTYEAAPLPPPVITAPSAGGTQLAGTSVTFSWTDSSGAIAVFRLIAGSSEGEDDYFASGNLGDDTSVVATGLPNDGESTVYVRLFYKTATGTEQFIDTTYEAAPLPPPVITAPSAGGTQLAGTSVTFSWTDSSGAIAVFRLIAGSSEGEDDYFASGNLGDDTSVVATGLPNDGESTVYVRLFYKTATGTEQFIDTTYEAAPLPPPVITAPSAGGTQLAGTSVTFSWTDSSGAIAVFRLIAGSSEGEDDYFASGNLGDDTSVVATGLPNDGESTVYVRLFYKTATGTEQFIDTTYEAAPLPPPVITAPSAGGTQLAGTSVTFSWTDSSGAIAVFRLIAGSSEGEDDYFASGNLGDDTSVVATGLPNDGESTVYVRLFYKTATGTEQFIDTTYQASMGVDPGIPLITSPVASGPFTQLNGSEVLTWNDNGTGAVEYWVYAGRNQSGREYYDSGNLGQVLTDTMTGLPADGSIIWVTLWYRTSTTAPWEFIEQAYTAAGSPPAFTAPVPDTQLEGRSATFSWVDTTTANPEFWVTAGSSQGGADYYNSGSLGSATTVVATGLPTDGSSTVHVRLWYRSANGPWLFVDTTYQAGESDGTTPEILITSPVPSEPFEELSGVEVFTWEDNGIGAVEYWLYAGSAQGRSTYYDSGSLGNTLSGTVTGLPVNGSTIWIRLWYRTATSSWQFIDQEYTAVTNSSNVPVLTTSGPFTQSNGQETLSWNAGASGATEYWLYAGDEMGSSTYYNSSSLGNTLTDTLFGLPVDGSDVWIRLWYKTSAFAQWQFIDQRYTAASSF